jgi:DNA-binding winged helix-turn-helix (wHTH) protein/tetratricopeptide (TPR) repeat protein
MMNSSVPTYRFGTVEFCPSNLQLRVDGEVRILEPKSHRTLAYLVENPGRVVSKEEILRTVWARTAVTDNALARVVAQIRKSLQDDPREPKYIETVSTVGYRFVGTLLPQEQEPPPPAPAPASPDSNSDSDTRSSRSAFIAEPAIGTPPTTLPATIATPLRGARRYPLAIAAGVAVVFAGTALLLPRTAPIAAGVKNSVLLGEFTNTTGDPVFDLTLRQGLAIQLEQSPFLSLASDEQIQQTLRLMGQPSGAKLTPGISREVCQRTGKAAVLNGSIAQIGTRYLLTLEAINCSTGDSVASAEAQASDKSHVLDALGETASQIRKKLGESHTTLQRFDTPLEQATTGSLEALQAYSLGRNRMAGRDWAGAVPLLRRAITVDPNFAMAYARLGMSYRNLGESSLGADNTRKAYALREQVSEVEKFYIDSHYFLVTVGDLQKTIEICTIWTQTYPRDWTASIDLADAYQHAGDHEKALPAALQTVQLNPTPLAYSTLVESYVALDRLDDARAAAAKGLDSPGVHFSLYQVAFLQNDAAGMAQQASWAKGRSGVDDVLLNLEANTAAYSGNLGQARELSRRAVASAKRAEETEVAAGYEATSAVREALFGNAVEARARAEDALHLSTGNRSQFLAALALAAAGQSARSRTLADESAARSPDDTIVQSYYLPTIRAQLELDRKDPAKAIEVLQTAMPFELSLPGELYPVYTRGQSYLAAHQGDKAAAEFQKILDHRGIVVNSPIGALAHLGLGRACVLSGDKIKAKAAYQDFLTLWKDSDPDIPVLKQAKAEYAKLN